LKLAWELGFEQNLGWEMGFGRLMPSKLAIVCWFGKYNLLWADN